ncbi:ABC transporter ATP-binding protein [Alteromonadaceae bacterium M269]|nr:ABC transporter ATP-binding protein [Alteromonadaceae bacterium M269]
MIISSSNEVKPDYTIEIKDLQFDYTKNDQTPLIDIPDWTVKSGEHVFLYGASGSGKSTFLNLLGGILKAQKGTIDIIGQTFSSMSQSKRDKFRAKHIGVVFQQFNLIPYLSILENLSLVRQKASRESKTQFKERVDILMTRLYLPTSALHERADRLSVGQRQRVAIMRALINMPELIIADEPTSSLDSDSRDAFMKLLIDLCSEHNSTLVFVSHDQSLKHYFKNHLNINELNRSTKVSHAV